MDRVGTFFGSELRNNPPEGGREGSRMRKKETEYELQSSRKRGYGRLHKELGNWNGPSALSPPQARGRGDRPLYPTSDLVWDVSCPQEGYNLGQGSSFQAGQFLGSAAALNKR